MAPRAPWSWKVSDRRRNDELGLRYEPGNWGDLLKGTWLAEAVTLLRARTSGTIRILDPFVGAPTYALASPAVRARLLALPPTQPLRVAQEAFVQSGRWASAAMLAHHLLRGRVELEVFDVDPRRRASWAKIESAHWLGVSDGAAALAHASREASGPDLALVDPYDLVGDTARLLAPSCALGRSCLVLAYLHNRSPRGRQEAEAYAGLRRDITARLSTGAGLLVGRIPSDARLPRAYHEVLLLGPTSPLRRLAPTLRAHTSLLFRMLGESGAFEQELAGA